MTTMRLIRCRGEIQESVHALVARLLEKNPHLVFREPVPTATRLKDFVGLGSPQPANFPEQPLDEARLFWIDTNETTAGSLHAVSTNYGDPESRRTRWTAFWEVFEDAKRDCSWMIDELQGDDQTLEPIELSDRETVSTLHDLARNRYGLPKLPDNNDSRMLRVFRYFYCGNPIAWRIEEVRTASVTE